MRSNGNWALVSGSVKNPVLARTAGLTRSIDLSRGDGSVSELLSHLEPEIVELVDKLNVKLFFLTIDVFSNIAKFIELLKISPGDKVILVMSSDDFMLLQNITKLLTSGGVVVLSYVSNRLHSGVFAIGIARKAA